MEHSNQNNSDDLMVQEIRALQGVYNLNKGENRIPVGYMGSFFCNKDAKLEVVSDALVGKFLELVPELAKDCDRSRSGALVTAREMDITRVVLTESPKLAAEYRILVEPIAIIIRTKDNILKIWFRGTDAAAEVENSVGKERGGLLLGKGESVPLSLLTNDKTTQGTMRAASWAYWTSPQSIFPSLEKQSVTLFNKQGKPSEIRGVEGTSHSLGATIADLFAWKAYLAGFRNIRLNHIAGLTTFDQGCSAAIKKTGIVRRYFSLANDKVPIIDQLIPQQIPATRMGLSAAIMGDMSIALQNDDEGPWTVPAFKTPDIGTFQGVAHGEQYVSPGEGLKGLFPFCHTLRVIQQNFKKHMFQHKTQQAPSSKEKSLL